MLHNFMQFHHFISIVCCTWTIVQTHAKDSMVKQKDYPSMLAVMV